MDDPPIGYFITCVTYGTWLPGDERGWVEYQRGWKLPSPARYLEAMAKMNEDACKLNSSQRAAVEDQIRETCDYRKWQLHAVNCRSNHMHIVVTAPNTSPKKVRIDLKAWSTRRLKSFDLSRKNWWAERGSVRWLFNDDSLEAAVTYTLDGQDRKPTAG
jgi:REP element-mobilizing transposase RayT